MNIKKFLAPFMAMALVFALVVASGCGTEKPKVGADKTAIALAELSLTGEASTPEDLVLNKGEAEKTKKQTTEGYTKMFQQYMLSEKDATEISEYLLKRMRTNLHPTAMVKDKDSETPTVELKITPLDMAQFQAVAMQDQDYVEMVQTIQLSRASGIDLSTNKEITDAVKITLKKVIEKIPVAQEKKITVKFKIGQTDDKKVAWTPENPDQFYKDVGNTVQAK